MFEKLSLFFPALPFDFIFSQFLTSVISWTEVAKLIGGPLTLSKLFPVKQPLLLQFCYDNDKRIQQYILTWQYDLFYNFIASYVIKILLYIILFYFFYSLLVFISEWAHIMRFNQPLVRVR